MRYKLPEGWKEVKLADIATFNSNNYREDEGWKFVNYLDTGNITNNIIDNIHYIDLETDKLPSRAKRKVAKDDIIYSTVRPIQKHLGFIKEPLTNMLVSTGFAVITTDKSKVEPNYLYLYLTQERLTNYLQSIAEQRVSAYPAINVSDLKTLNIYLPPIEEQKAIADTLSVLDDKIEINYKISKNLEAQAQAIFKHWFIDFEFPDENGNPYKSSGGEMVESELGMIPRGWEIVKLRDLAKRENGYSYKSVDMNEDSNNKLLTLKNFNRNGSYNADGYRRIDITDRVREHHYVKNGDILLACTDLTQDGDVVGNPIIYYPSGKFNKVIFSMDLVKLVPKSAEYNFFILYNLKTKHFKEYAKNHSTGTTVLHLQKSSIDNYDLLKPSNNLIVEFNKLIEIIHNQKVTLQYQNQTLSQLRDTLLPKLMSGEIRIPLDELKEVSV